MKYDLVIISGYFNPIHVGHLDYIAEARTKGNRLAVIVNNDNQVKLKGSVPFMDEFERFRIVRAVSDVDATVMSIDTGSSVIQTLRDIVMVNLGSKILFATGADHTVDNTKDEAALCKELGIDIAYGVGGHKVQSSSKLLENVK